MIRNFHRITIIKNRKPPKHLNEEIKWLASSLGLINQRDKDRSCFRIFVVLLQNKDEGLSSDEIAYKLELSRGTVVHHLERIIETGIIIPEHNKYILRSSNLNQTVEEIQRDIENTWKAIRETASKIDKKLGL